MAEVLLLASLVVVAEVLLVSLDVEVEVGVERVPFGRELQLGHPSVNGLEGPTVSDPYHGVGPASSVFQGRERKRLAVRLSLEQSLVVP